MKLLPASIRKHPAAVGVFVCLFVIALLVIRNLYTPETDARFAAIRQGGYPVTLADLNAFYTEVPDDQNRALVYEKVFRSGVLTNDVFDDLMSNFSPTRGQPLPPELVRDFAAAVATHADSWQLLYSATNYSGSRYPLDMRQGMAVLLPHLAQVKGAATLLCLEAFCHASAGEADQCWAALHAAMCASDSLRNEPILISYLVRIASSVIVAKRTEECLNLVAFGDEELRDLQREFAGADDPRCAARALAGERAFGLSFFIDRSTQRSVSQGALGGGPFPGGFGGQLAISAYKATGLMTRDRNFFLDALGKSVALAEDPAEERVKLGPPPGIITTNRFLIFSRMMLPALQRVLDRADEHAARMRVIATGLAVERFRLAHSGNLPDNLGQLAPQFIAAVPLDPFDSQPLRYKKLPRGYVVYSIGADQKDDGGAEPRPNRNSGRGARGTPTDLTFVVERQ